MNKKFLAATFRRLLVCLTFLSLFAFPMRSQVQTERHVSPASKVSDVRHVELTPSREVVHLVDDRLDTIVRTVKHDISHYTDTLTTVVMTPDSTLQHRVETLPVDSQDRRGHYIEAYLGLGYGTMGYELKKVGEIDGHVNGSFSALLQFQYAYFFHKNVGIGVGLWVSNYTSHAHLEGSKEWSDQTDTDSELKYTHHTDIKEWRERETVHNLGIPVSLQFQAWKPGKKAGFFADFGVAPSFQVGKKYKLLDGTLEHTAHYPNWNLDLSNMHEFGTRDYTGDDDAKGKMNVKYSIAVFADLGVLFKVTPQVDIFLGGYFTYSANDVNNSDKRELGWGSDKEYAFMDRYESAYSLTNAGKSRPWEAGLKLGVHWRKIRKPERRDVEYYDYFTRRDTTVSLVERYDTVTVEHIDTILSPIKKAAVKVEKFNKIYFDFDSSVLTEESKTYLRSINDVLSEVSDTVRISIQGHASKEGLRKHNEALARRRAEAVANYLVEQGLSRKRIEVISFGSLVENDENVNHELPLDRRVEVKVITDDKEHKYSNKIVIKSKK